MLLCFSVARMMAAFHNNATATTTITPFIAVPLSSGKEPIADERLTKAIDER